MTNTLLRWAQPTLQRIVCAIVFSLVRVAAADDVQLGLRVPDGFEVTEFADHTLANDIYSMTLDPHGRVVVSGRGYVRILVDDDRDGRADRALPFADGPADGAMGMLWEGASLFVTGDGGLRRYRDEDGDGRADGPSELIRAMATGGEHSSHAIRRGPDGWLYVIVGNMTGVDASYAELPTSPVREPVAGCILRFTPDLKSSEIVADGFRNAYDMDFNLDGELFAYDSDNERCVSLPWYEPTRFYHVIPGGHYGWRAPQRAGFWRFPPYFFDVVAPLAYLDRGSPTGVVCYRHTAFPFKYWGGMFALDWTFGRIYFLPLARTGSTYTTTPELFAEAVGDNGFAPTDVVVHPTTGDLFVSVGGRGTRGAVYRIRPRGGGVRSSDRATAASRFAPGRLEWDEQDRSALLDRASGDDALARLRALNLILRHPQRFDDGDILRAVRANGDHPDRYVRHATAKLVASLSPNPRRTLGAESLTARQRVTYGWGIYQEEPRQAARVALGVVAVSTAGTAQRLESVRLLQVALGGVSSELYRDRVWEGYSRAGEQTDRDNKPTGAEVNEAIAELASEVLRQAFPSGDADLDRELSRTLALLEDDAPESVTIVADKLTQHSPPVADVHYLIVLSRLRGPRTANVTATVARALLALDRKVRDLDLNRDRNWPLRLSELHRELARKDPDLNGALVASPEFGRPDHVLFAENEGFDHRRAAEVFFNRATGDEDYAWNPEIVRLLGALGRKPADALVRHRWDDVALRDAVLGVLAERPELQDRPRFLAGLASPQLTTVARSVAALEVLAPVAEGAEVLAVVRALGRTRAETAQEEQVRTALERYLERVAGRATTDLGNGGWGAWFAETYPELARQLEGADGIDLATWKARLDGVDWSRGDAERGSTVYTKAACAACHSTSRALGPDLHGVAARFSRDDLFTAILQPNRDVPPRYQTTLVVTFGGKTYQGTVIYEAVDGLLLQTGPAETVRIPGERIESQQSVPRSLMPAGLLDPLSDDELADLYAYLKGLRQ